QPRPAPPSPTRAHAADPAARQRDPPRSPGYRPRRAPGRGRPRPHLARRLQLMRVWRLCRRAHAAPDGEGARRYGGRWNQRGTALIYTSASGSLAALEYFVHLDPEDAPPDLILIPADIPPSPAIKELRVEELPADWRSLPAPDALAHLGTSWARQLQSAVLSVPSAMVPEERNYLLNPAHPEFRKITFAPARPFSFDPRMRKRPRGRA